MKQIFIAVILAFSITGSAQKILSGEYGHHTNDYLFFDVKEGTTKLILQLDIKKIDGILDGYCVVEYFDTKTQKYIQISDIYKLVDIKNQNKFWNLDITNIKSQMFNIKYVSLNRHKSKVTLKYF